MNEVKACAAPPRKGASLSLDAGGGAPYLVFCAAVHNARRQRRLVQAARKGSQGVSLGRQIAFWVGAIVACILFLLVFAPILLPFVAGMILAYLLNPIADRLQQLGSSRLVATLIILAAFVVIFALVLVILVRCSSIRSAASSATCRAMRRRCNRS